MLKDYEIKFLMDDVNYYLPNANVNIFYIKNTNANLFVEYDIKAVNIKGLIRVPKDVIESSDLICLSSEIINNITNITANEFIKRYLKRPGL